MRYFRYDKSGNQTLSASYWDDPNGPGGDGLTGDGDPDVLLVTRTFYDANDRVTGTAQYTLDPNLWTVDPFEYPQFGTATELADAAQLDSETPDWETVTEYNVLGQVERTVDRYGTETINTYDPRGNLVETRTASKDLFGSAAWVVTRTIYDDNGRVIFTTDPYDMEMELYDAAGGQGFPRPGTYTQYDDAGRVVRTARYQSVAVQLLSAAGGTKTSYTPTDFEIATPLSESFTYYDDAGRVAFTVDPAGLITEFDYDDAGRQEFVTQYLTGTLNTSTWQVDGIVDPSTDVLVTETQYDAAGRVERTIDANGVETKFEYDGVGRVTQTIADEGDPLQGHLNVTTTTHYDKLGHKDYELDALGLRTDYEYDTAGRLTAVILPEVDDPLNPGQRVRPRYEYRYDAYGNQVLIRDPMDDDFGVGSDDKETTFTYDHLGRQTTRTLPEAQTETFTYNTLGQQTLHVDFEDRHTAFEYDEFGRLRKKKFYTDAATYNGGAGTPDQTVTYFDDALGRTVATNDSQFVVATFYVYDAEGRVTRVDSPQGDIHYEYDDLGRLTRTYSGEESDSDGTNVAGDGQEVTDTRYSYDRLGRLKTVSVYERNDTPQLLVGNPTEVTQYSYDQVGNVETVTTLKRTWTGISVVSSFYTSLYEYDALNRLDKLTQQVTQINPTFAAQVAEYDYEVRADGKRTGVIETNNSGQQTAIEWFYDELGRLTEERYDSHDDGLDFMARYSFDLASNRVSLEKDLGNADPVNFNVDEAIAYLYDANDRLLREQIDTTASDQTIFYQYGASNDRTEQTQKATYAGLHDDEASAGTPSSVTTYSYNLQGRLETVEVNEDGTGAPEQTITYQYNDDGIRVSQSVDGLTTIYHVDPNNHTGYTQVLEEGVDDVDTDGELEVGEIDRTYTLGLDVIAQADEADAPYIFLYDGHGSTRALYDPARLVAGQGIFAQNGSGQDQLFAYDAYGNAIGFDPQEAITAILHTGEWTESITGLNYHRARWYDPATGRWKRLDPILGNHADPLSLHKYLYANADPITFIDPSGNFSIIGTSAANGIASMLASLQGEVGLNVLDSIAAEIAGFSAESALIANIALGGGFLAAAPIMAAGLKISVGHAAALLSKASGLLFENVAIRVLRDVAGETIIRTKFLRGAVDRGVDFVSIVGRGADARLVFNEVKNVKGSVSSRSFTALGLGAGGRQVWEKNLDEAIKAINAAVDIDDATRIAIERQLRDRQFVVRAIGSAKKQTTFASDLLLNLRNTIGAKVDLEILLLP